MSTRCTIHFEQYGKTQAIIYRHADGYPEGGVLPDLDEFFTAVEAQTKDTRFDDASYLAAKFVVWQAGQYAYHFNAKYEREPSQPLDFLGVAPVMGDPGDIEFRYHVQCSGSSRPQVTWEEA